MMREFLADDKSQVIFVVMVLGIGDIVWAVISGNPPGHIGEILTGLFGVAVGKYGKQT